MAGMSAVEQQVSVWPPRVRGESTVDDLLHSPDDGPVPVGFDPAVLVG